jgi:hypothetical protein
MVIGFKLPMQSVPITTNIVRSNPTQIKFVSDLQQVGGFLRVLQFPPPIKLTAKEEYLSMIFFTEHAVFQ